MNELKIGEVGRINGQIVKCKEFSSCDRCVFNTTNCKDIHCWAHQRKDECEVMFTRPIPNEIKEFENKEKQQ